MEICFHLIAFKLPAGFSRKWIQNIEYLTFKLETTSKNISDNNGSQSKLKKRKKKKKIYSAWVGIATPKQNEETQDE